MLALLTCGFCVPIVSSVSVRTASAPSKLPDAASKPIGAVARWSCQLPLNQNAWTVVWARFWV